MATKLIILPIFFIFVFHAKATIHIIGFHSLCQDNRNKSSTNNMAFAAHKLMEASFKKWKKEDFQYLHYDVCNDVDKMMTIAVNLTTDVRYEKAGSKLEVMMIMAFLEDPLNKVVLYTWNMWKYKPLLHLLNPDTEIIKNGYYHHSNRLELFTANRISSSMTNHILELIAFFNWQNIGLIWVKSKRPDDEIYRQDYIRLVKSLKHEKSTCFMTTELNFDQGSDYHVEVFNEIEAGNITVIFLFGEPSSQNKLYGNYNRWKRFGVSSVVWMFQDVKFTNFPSRSGIISSWISIRLYRSQHGLNSSYVKNRLSSVFNSLPNDWMAFDELTVFLHLLNNKILNYMITKYKKHSPPIRVFKGIAIITRVYWFYFQGGRRGYMAIWSPPDRTAEELKHIFHKASCSVHQCPSGMTTHFGSVLNNQIQGIWDSGYGWTCRECPNGSYKPGNGNFKCRQCPEFTVPSKDRTKCLNPYIPLKLQFNTIGGVLCLVVNVIAVFILVITLAIIIKFRNTPIGRSLDIKLTSSSLCSNLIGQLLCPYLFLGSPVLWKCIFRPIFITSVNAITVIAMATRLQKIMYIFNSHTRLCKRDVTIGKFQQIFFILLSLFMNTAVFILTCQLQTPTIVSKRNPNTMRLEVMCNTYLNFNLCLLYIVFLYIVCFVQAFRGRKLPGLFHEPVTMAYLCFTQIVMLGVSFPISHFQKEGTRKLVVQWLLISTSTIVGTILGYGNKVVVLLWRKDLNCEKHVRLETFAAMQKKTGWSREPEEIDRITSGEKF